MTVRDRRSRQAEDVVVPPGSVRESLLVFSDVHLGSDIHDGAVNKARRSLAVDRDLVRLLAHYRAQQPPADRWRIVIAGDFIDFIGISIAATPEAGIETEPNDEERAHGIGSAVDHARLKLARVAERHADVFAELAAFVADGHALSLVHGNHDIEFHWDEVKDDFRAMLARQAVALGRAVDDAAFAERIEFNPWFFYRDGVAYIEHGHQYDPFCATQNIMAPISPLDPRRVARGFCDTLIRYVVRPTRGMKEHGHEHVGMVFYFTFGMQLGITGMVKLGVAFVNAVREMFRLRRGSLSEAAKALRVEHEERVAKLAAVTRLGVERLRALLKLQVPPITSSIGGIMKSVLLDRLAVGFVALVALLGILVIGGLHGRAAWAAGAVIAAWIGLHVYFARQRSVDASENMVDRAAHLAKLFPAAFVVMGHTHIPVSVPAGDATTYINVGSWAEEVDEEAVDSAYRAARTHLVIHVRDDRAEAQFCTWEDTGPQPVAVKTKSAPPGA
jgi:UDP-2,3-diacylglucosamine pyrophosphatase LpxH